jgi:hypothetical protein
MNSLVLSALPDAVSKVANGDFLGHFPVGERLLTDQRMERVWKTLRTEGIKLAQSNPEAFEKELNELPNSYRRESWDDARPSDRFGPPTRRVTYPIAPALHSSSRRRSYSLLGILPERNAISSKRRSGGEPARNYAERHFRARIEQRLTLPLRRRWPWSAITLKDT